MPLALLDVLRERAALLAAARTFFAERKVLEVDCAALFPEAQLDANVEPMSAWVLEGQRGFLHTSPEYAMKRLLAQGSGDIYYLGHVFRKGEVGRLHNPEFTMAEWYRLGFSLEQMMEETVAFLALFLGPLPQRRVRYVEAFSLYAGVDPLTASSQELYEASLPYSPPKKSAAAWSRETLIHFLLAHAVEPKLGQQELCFLCDYPPEEAALARVVEKEGQRVAKRFEIYHRGIELANGFHELCDPSEARRRFTEENQARLEQGKEPLPSSEALLQSLEQGLPDCCGVSVGFERALLLRHNQSMLREVLPFAWES